MFSLLFPFCCSWHAFRVLLINKSSAANSWAVMMYFLCLSIHIVSMVFEIRAKNNGTAADDFQHLWQTISTHPLGDNLWHRGKCIDSYHLYRLFLYFIQIITERAVILELCAFVEDFVVQCVRSAQYGIGNYRIPLLSRLGDNVWIRKPADAFGLKHTRCYSN